MAKRGRAASRKGQKREEASSIARATQRLSRTSATTLVRRACMDGLGEPVMRDVVRRGRRRGTGARAETEERLWAPGEKQELMSSATKRRLRRERSELQLRLAAFAAARRTRRNAGCNTFRDDGRHAGASAVHRRLSLRTCSAMRRWGRLVPCRHKRQQRPRAPSARAEGRRQSSPTLARKHSAVSGLDPMPPLGSERYARVQ
jgi:hypothetical protein